MTAGRGDSGLVGSMGSVGSVVVYADGGSRGNPGPAGYGTAVYDETGVVLAERAAALGRATNNVAEYSGLIAGLEAARDLGARRVSVRMDSKLVVEQMSGRWQVKHPDMKPLARRAAELVRGFDAVELTWIPRAKNAHADRLANEAMDAAAEGSAWTAPDPAATPIPPADQDPAAAMPASGRAPVTQVVVVRHGETTWGATHRFAGREDVPLTERGRRQADDVARRVAPLAPTVVLSSPLQRCRDTAETIARRTGAPVVLEHGLMDGLLGEWTGLRAEEIERAWPDEFAVWRADPDASPPGGGESFSAIRRRLAPLVRDLVTAHAGETLVLVTHAATSKMILAEALGVPSTAAYRFRIDTGSISGFSVQQDGSVMVWAVNETGHLAPDVEFAGAGRR